MDNATHYILCECVSHTPIQIERERGDYNGHCKKNRIVLVRHLSEVDSYTILDGIQSGSESEATVKQHILTMKKALCARYSTCTHPKYIYIPCVVQTHRHTSKNE